MIKISCKISSKISCHKLQLYSVVSRLTVFSSEGWRDSHHRCNHRLWHGREQERCAPRIWRSNPWHWDIQSRYTEYCILLYMYILYQFSPGTLRDSSLLSQISGRTGPSRLDNPTGPWKSCSEHGMEIPGYYQEAGRAGRDGRRELSGGLVAENSTAAFLLRQKGPATSIIFYDYEERVSIKSQSLLICRKLLGHQTTSLLEFNGISPIIKHAQFMDIYVASMLPLGILWKKAQDKKRHQNMALSDTNQADWQDHTVHHISRGCTML